MAMNIVKLLMCAYIVGMMAFPFLIFFNAVTSIIGVILFFYLWRTQQLEISGKVFFLLPHILLFFGFMGCIRGNLLALPEKWTGSFDDVFQVAYAINQYGMPFLLYCFLQVTGRYYPVAARVYCFVLPVLTIFGTAYGMR